MGTPLPPITLPWAQKPLESAEVDIERLWDGRRRFHIRHEILRDVTPEMLVFWFQNLEGDLQVGGQTHSRYRVWHPRDHVSVRYAKRLPDGSVGPGAKIHIVEFFGANPSYGVDVVATIERLDLGGFTHVDHMGGLEVARMNYSFTRVAGGTLYENELIVGNPGALGGLVNPVAQHLFPDEKGRAWLLHNIEEVGALENFLPAFYETEQMAPRRETSEV